MCHPALFVLQTWMIPQIKFCWAELKTNQAILNFTKESKSVLFCLCDIWKDMLYVHFHSGLSDVRICCKEKLAFETWLDIMNVFKIKRRWCSMRDERKHHYYNIVFCVIIHWDTQRLPFILSPVDFCGSDVQNWGDIIYGDKL